MSLDTLKARIQYAGGDQLSRIKTQKYRSFLSALKNDYNSRQIKLLKNDELWQCLINTENIKTDYTKQYLSIDYASGLEGGDTFMTTDTGEVWMCYLQDFVEIAYYSTDIVKCRYTVDIDGETYWIYFQGPTETDVRWNKQKNKNYNELNLSGTVYIKKNDSTRAFFDRFTKIKIDGHTWETQVTDSISVPGIIELEVQEYFENTAEDLPEIKRAEPLYWQTLDDVEQIIIGQTSIKVNTEVGYEINPSFYDESYTWSIEGNNDVSIEGTLLDNRICRVKAVETASGNFTLKYGDQSLEVELLSIGSSINGKEIVYPYSVEKYTVSDKTGTFRVDNANIARIIKNESDNCMVEIITGRKGKFVLSFDSYDNEYHYELPITVDSL